MSKLNNRVALFKGATGGIGFEAEKRLGKDGYMVILNGIGDAAGAKKVQELVAEGIPAEYFGFALQTKKL